MAIVTSEVISNTIKLPNYFTVTADFTSATWNTVASHEIATVTGMVHMVIIPQCTATLIDAANAAIISLGYEGATTALIGTTQASGATSATAIETNEFWVDTTPTDTTITRTKLHDLAFIIGGGLDIGYDITVAALVDGTMIFHVWWEGLDSTGAVAAGAGGSL